MDNTIYGVEIGHICIGDYAAVIYKSKLVLQCFINEGSVRHSW